MKGFVTNIEKDTVENNDYRRVIYTGRYSQLVLMNIKPGVEIGNEMHGLDQFIRIEEGQAKLILNNSDEQQIEKDFAVVIPAGTWHNIVNNGQTDLKLYTLYSPPAHLKDTLQPTKADEVEDQFNGITSEE